MYGLRKGPEGWTEELAVGDTVYLETSSRVTICQVEKVNKNSFTLVGHAEKFQRGPSSSKWFPYENEGKAQGQFRSFYCPVVCPHSQENTDYLEAEAREKEEDRNHKNRVAQIRDFVTYHADPDVIAAMAALVPEQD